jgi:hypothetical protein
MTLAQSFASKPRSFESPVFFDGFHRIVGAGGIKSAAVSQKRTKSELIPFDEES